MCRPLRTETRVYSISVENGEFMSLLAKTPREWNPETLLLDHALHAELRLISYNLLPLAKGSRHSYEKTHDYSTHRRCSEW